MKSTSKLLNIKGSFCIISLSILIAAACGSFVTNIWAQSNIETEAELVRETERKRIKALVEGNMEVARQLHADDFQLINPDGTAKTKEQYLGGLASGEADYLIWEPKTIVVRMYGDAAVIRYQSKIQIVIQGVDSGLNSLWHTDLYEKHDGQWQVVWSHANLIQ